MIPPQYPSVSYFYEGIAYTQQPDGKYCLMDKTGRVLRCPSYKFVGGFQDGIALAREGEHHNMMRSFYIDKEGNEYRDIE